jgi:hypothetical protein
VIETFDHYLNQSKMERYRKLKVIGKGSFGYAVLVQSVADRHSYVMKVRLSIFPALATCLTLFACPDHRRVKDGPQAARRRHQRSKFKFKIKIRNP